MKNAIQRICITLFMLFAVPAFANGSGGSSLAQQIAALQAAVANLQSSNRNLSAQVTALQTANTALSSKVAALSSNSVLALNGRLGLTGNTALFTGVDVQIVNGSGSTAGPTPSGNGGGNLIIGYNENMSSGVPFCSDGQLGATDVSACLPPAVWGAYQHTGSHNLVIGDGNSYTSYAGTVVGFENSISAPYAVVSSGIGNLASFPLAAVAGGAANRSSGWASTVGGGANNSSSGMTSAVGGGANNSASGMASSVSGGDSVISSKDFGWSAATLSY